MKFMTSLEKIVKNKDVPFVNKSIALLAISNIYTLSVNINLSEETKDFAFFVLENWKNIRDED